MVAFGKVFETRWRGPKRATVGVLISFFRSAPEKAMMLIIVTVSSVKGAIALGISLGLGGTRGVGTP